VGAVEQPSRAQALAQGAEALEAERVVTIRPNGTTILIARLPLGAALAQVSAVVRHGSLHAGIIAGREDRGGHNLARRGPVTRLCHCDEERWCHSHVLQALVERI
jgi:hypothetical protein